jgi:pimeloyl-ACP methyl ester carboxylesterase
MSTTTKKRLVKGAPVTRANSGVGLPAGKEVTRRRFLQASVGLGPALAFSGADIGRAEAASDGTSPATAITPFKLEIPESVLKDLKRRLQATRWPEREPVIDWSQGAPLARVQALVDYWRTKYDWRRCEATLNRLGQFKTPIDGVGIHFLHVRSRHANALPLILTHGWPGSVVEFLKVIGPLTDPTAHGRAAEDAFHLVVPSLPGYGFSDKPTVTGWGAPRIAQAWAALMQRLGYKRYVAQGGDWGAAVTTHMAQQRPAGLLGIHLNMPLLSPPGEGEPNAAEKAALDQMRRYDTQLSGYARIQSTRPQTLGYSLADSPAGLAAWIYEKFAEWTDSQQNPESVLTYDEMLDNIMLYWLPGTGASSARLYWESFGRLAGPRKVDLPVGCSIFPGEIVRPPRGWAERTYSNLIYWNELARGGHFAAFEQPQLFVDELRACFRKLR